MSKKKKADIPAKLEDTVCSENLSLGEDDYSLSGSFEGVILDPSARIKALAESGNAFEVDHNIPPRRYYRSGLEMVRMADVYFKEGNLENAYILYMKFMTLFLEKIRKHPNFKTVSVVDRAQNDAKLKEVLPKAEKLKMKLLELYEKDYQNFLQNQEKLKEEKKRLQEEQKREGNRTEEITKPIEENKVTPKVDRSTKPALLRPLSQINVTLRDIIVPSKLMSKFLILSVRNTEQNRETCGILAGVLQKDRLYVSHLLIPKQTGSADCCSTENEEEIFAFQDEHNLITLGWIHHSYRFADDQIRDSRLYPLIFDLAETHGNRQAFWVFQDSSQPGVNQRDKIKQLVFDPGESQQSRHKSDNQTHPSQTAFLSSVDLHTQCSYQLMMPEALAIVCSPKNQENCFFMLTPEYGLDFIANCRQSGFHPHPTEPPLYRKAEHLKLEDLPVEVVDLRRR